MVEDVEAVWATLVEPRPTPVANAPRVTVAELIVAAAPESEVDGVSTALGMTELVSLGLLHRQDVHFVERRRFAPAAQAERQGLPRPAGAPPVGTSPGAEWLLAGSWVGVPGDSSTVDLRLIHVESGVARASTRFRVPAGADLVGVSRRVNGALLALLDDEGLLPDASDAAASPALRSWEATEVPRPAFDAFRRGIAAEDAFQWERARHAYGEAIQLSGGEFAEAALALTRAARLRAGGTLGSS